MLGRIFSIVFTASAASLIATQSTYSSVASISRAHFGVEHRPAGPLVDEAVRRDGDDQDVAELARGFQMTDMPEVKKIERAVSLNDDLAAGASLLGDPAKLVQRPHLVARTVHRRQSAGGSAL